MAGLMRAIKEKSPTMYIFVKKTFPTMPHKWFTTFAKILSTPLQLLHVKWLFTKKFKHCLRTNQKAIQNWVLLNFCSWKFHGGVMHGIEHNIYLSIETSISMLHCIDYYQYKLYINMHTRRFH